MVARPLLIAIGLICCVASWVQANETVRYYEKDGVTYRETRRVEQQPVVETRTETSNQTVYREESVTELRDTVRERWTPVTEYRWEAFWVNRWNPLAKPYMAYRYVPHTRWERSVDTVQTPVVCRRLVPEKRVVHVPVTRQRMVEREVISRVAVRSTPAPTVATRTTTSAPRVAWAPPSRTGQLVPVASYRGPVGGVARLDEKDPPREGTSTAWQSSGTTRR